MAQDPLPAGPSTSYSDPIYERLESAKGFLARRWPFYLLMVVVVTALVLGIRWWRSQSPEASSAVTYAEAQAKGRDALRPLLTDTAITPGYRARAGLALALEEQKQGRPAEALAALAQVKPAAHESQDPVLLATVILSEAALHEEAASWDAAATAYRQAQQLSGAQHGAHTLTALLGQARVAMAQAAAAPDAATALSLRQAAKGHLDSAVSESRGGSEPLVRLALYQLEQLKLRHPEVLGITPVPPAYTDPVPPAPETPAVGETKPDQPAPTAPAETSQPAPGEAKPAENTAAAAPAAPTAPTAPAGP